MVNESLESYLSFRQISEHFLSDQFDRERGKQVRKR